jgi:hypothetical protein
MRSAVREHHGILTPFWIAPEAEETWVFGNSGTVMMKDKGRMEECGNSSVHALALL